jgi:hypothetical protein
MSHGVAAVGGEPVAAGSAIDVGLHDGHRGGMGGRRAQDQRAEDD